MNKKLNKQNGITLIALIITIIVMLILVGVTISMAVNGGLFGYAGKAVGDTEEAKRKEQELGTGKIEVDGKLYNNIDDYIDGKYVGYVPTYSEAEFDGEYLAQKATYTSGDYTAVIPKGFKIIPGINNTTTIADGLVIQDKEGNEFVWIPVEGEVEGKKLVNPYNAESGYSEPTALEGIYGNSNAAYDSQTTLTYLYGNKFNYDSDFNYTKEYKEMVAQVNKNNGFYIGRYETTIDESGIGSKYNKKVLTAGDQFTNNGESYYYRWYGLYYFQKNANVTGNGETVQTAMIYGQLWDKAMEFIRTNDTNYNVGSPTSAWHGSSNGNTEVVNSGQANKTTVGVNGAIGDVALNIWDLEANAREWTQEADSTYFARVTRGGYYRISYSASNRGSSNPNVSVTYYSSRLALYIK